tara:strand:+ start:39 stop:788 length:750 start_codon:yes stop_codon:yes gene_type:complete
MKSRKKFIFQKNLYSTKQKISVFNIANYLLLKELNLVDSFYGNSIDQANKVNFLKTIKILSLREAKFGVYLSPLMAIEHEAKFNFCITENDISSIFYFMVNELLPLYKFQDEYIAVLLYDILRTNWAEDECKYACGEYFLRGFFMKNSVTPYIKNSEFCKKFMSFLFQNLDWIHQRNAFSYANCKYPLEPDDIKIETDYEGTELEKNEAQNLFKNVILGSNLGFSMANSIKFKCCKKFEKSIHDIYWFN